MLMRIYKDRYDPVNNYVYLKPSDPKSLYKIAYAFADIDFLHRSKKASKLYVIFNATKEFQEIRKNSLSLARELKRISTIL